MRPGMEKALLLGPDHHIMRTILNTALNIDAYALPDDSNTCTLRHAL